MTLLPDFLRDLTTTGLSSFSSSEPLLDDAETEAVVLREGFDLLLLEPGDPDTWSVDMLWTAGDLFVGERTPTPLIGDGPALANLLVWGLFEEIGVSRLSGVGVRSPTKRSP